MRRKDINGIEIMPGHIVTDGGDTREPIRLRVMMHIIDSGEDENVLWRPIGGWHKGDKEKLWTWFLGYPLVVGFMEVDEDGELTPVFDYDYAQKLRTLGIEGHLPESHILVSNLNLKIVHTDDQ